MNEEKNILDGDKLLWRFIIVFSAISFLPVYSASSNLVYVLGQGDTLTHLIKHGVFVMMGLTITFLVHKLEHRRFRTISLVGIFVSIILLVAAQMTGTVIQGANAARWINIFGFTFQPSALALIVLMMYAAHYITDDDDKPVSFLESFVGLWVPTMIIIGLILISNLSTALIVFTMLCMLLLIGGYPVKHLFYIGIVLLVLLIIFLLAAKAFPELFPTRLDTWISRITNFFSSEKNLDNNYQSEHAKMAIASAGLIGEGPGESIMKYFVAHSASDFIYTVVVEEYGIILGGIGAIVFYLFLLWRILVISNAAKTPFAKLLVLGVGFPIVFQAFIHMGVSVDLLPVTGQTLPFISSGGSAIIMTYLSMGVILSVSSRKNKSSETEENKKKDNND